MKTAVSILAFLATFVVPAEAQELISPDEFLDVAEGNTLTFRRFGTGELVGTEEFLSRNLSVWRWSTGECVYGRIVVEESQICFYYDGDIYGPDCWWPFRDGERLLVRYADITTISIQEVTEISKETLHCPSIPSAKNVGEISPSRRI